jgi:tetratricopeptide (TPR) repeat protein
MRTVATSALLALSLASSAVAEPRAEHEPQRTQANQAYQSGDYAKVIELTSGILTANNTDDVALHLRGSARVELGLQQQNGQLLRDGIADSRTAIETTKTGSYNYYLPYLYGMTNLGISEKNPAHAKVSVDIATQLLGRQGIEAESRANIHYQRGLAKNALGETAAAIEDFKAATTTFPKHLGALMALADAQAVAGQNDAVLATYNQAIQALPNEPLVYNNQGMFLQKSLGKTNEAIQAFSTALQKNPNYFVALTNRGFSYLEGGNAAQAEKDFTASLQMNPNQIGVYSLRGSAKLMRGQWKEALVDYEVVVKSDPTNYVAHSDVGFAKYFGRDYAGALESFNKVVQLQPTAYFMNPWRIITLIRLGRGQEAAAIAQTSRTKPEAMRDWIDHVILFHVGDMTSTQLLSQVAKADKTVQAAQTCEARFFIAEQFMIAGQQTQAAQSYQQAIQTQARQLSAYRGSLYALNKFQ